MMTLPSPLKLNDARKYKKELFASLSPVEVEILDAVAVTGGRCMGNRPGAASGRVMLDKPGAKKSEMLENGQAVVNAMTRAGWLRFAESAGVKDFGYYWMTDSAKRLWEVLDRKVS